MFSLKKIGRFFFQKLLRFFNMFKRFLKNSYTDPSKIPRILNRSFKDSTDFKPGFFKDFLKEFVQTSYMFHTRSSSGLSEIPGISSDITFRFFFRNVSKDLLRQCSVDPFKHFSRDYFVDLQKDSF